MLDLLGGELITDEQHADMLALLKSGRFKEFERQCRNIADAISLNPAIAIRPNAGMGWRF